VAGLSLFPLYHRLYDAFLLILPMGWALMEFYGPQRKGARGALLLMLPFLVPGGTILEHLQFHERIPRTIAHSWYWTGVVMPHEIWFLLLLSLLLLCSMAGSRDAVPSRPGDYSHSSLPIGSPSGGGTGVVRWISAGFFSKRSIWLAAKKNWARVASSFVAEA
jgi:hypothetical protein